MLNPTQLEQEESVEELLSSIRSLVYPNAIKNESLIAGEPSGPSSSSKAQLQETLSSFTKIIHERSQPLMQKTIEGFFEEAIKQPLHTLLKEAEPMIFTLIEKYIQDHLPSLLAQWMDVRLPAVVKECVNNYLKNFQNQR